MTRPLAAVALAVSFVIGCGPTPRDYTVLVHNASDRPMTVVLTKDGPPMETKWLPPEDFAAMLHPPADAKVNGIVIKPGQTVDQTRHGDFSAGTNATLRIYSGEQTLESMLGIGPDSPNRTDLRLRPGRNDVQISVDGKASLQ